MAAILSVSLKNPDGTYTKCIIKVYDTPDKYGNNVAMYVEQTEAEKNANAKKTYLANGKVIWTDGSVCKPTKPLPEAEQVKEVAKKPIAVEPKFEDSSLVDADCIGYIKKTKNILANGYYVDLKNISKIKEFSDFVLPHNLDLVLIGCDSSGQGNINSRQTILGEGVNLLSEFLQITKQQSYVLLDYYDKHSRRFDNLDRLDEIVNRSIVIIDRNKIVSTNYNHKPQNNELFSNFHIAEKIPAQNSFDDIDDLPF